MDGVPFAWLPRRNWLSVTLPTLDELALTGVKGREFCAYSTRQNVVFNNSSVRRRVTWMVYSNVTTDQLLPGATLMRRTWRVEPPLNALMCNFRGDVEHVSFSNTFTELFLRSNEVHTIIRPNHSRSSPTGDQPLHSHYTGTSFHGRDDFNMDSTSSETSEETSPPLLDSPTNGDVEWAEVINPGVGKGRRLVCGFLIWEVCHDRLNGCFTELSTQDAD